MLILKGLARAVLDSTLGSLPVLIALVGACAFLLACRRVKRARKHGPGSEASDSGSSDADSDTGGSDLDGDDDSDSDSIGNEEVMLPH